MRQGEAGGFAVDADRVFVSPVLGQLHGFVAGRVVKDGAVPPEGVFRHPKTAGRLYRLHGEQHDLAQAGQGLEVGNPVGPVGVGGANHAGRSIQAQDQRGGIKRAKHDCQAGVFEQMGRCFVAAAGQVEVAHRMRIEHPERVHAFGREVDPTGNGSGGGEK
jgi:hypothetical protein